MWDLILDTILDTLKIIPILLIFYLFMELLERKTDFSSFMQNKLHRFGPCIGALLGCIPQCGFSTACAALYNQGLIGAGILIAVFLSTSDEAIPILFAHFSDFSLILELLLWKVLIAIVAGYFLQFTIFRNEKNDVRSYDHSDDCILGDDCHCQEEDSLLKCAILHTIKISLFILLTMIVVNIVVYVIGMENLQNLLLTNSVFQPCLTALIGLIPGCTTSVLLTELFLNGSLSFGSTIAGLSSGAGFGYLVLMKGKNKKNALRIIFYTFFTAAVFGMLIQQIMI